MNDSTPDADAKRERERERKHRYYQENRERIRERARQRHEANPEIKRERDRRYREANPNKNREYHEAHRDQIHAQQKSYRVANRDRINARNRIGQRERYKRQQADPELRERRNARAREWARMPQVRLRKLERLHGLPPGGWDALWAEQDGRCYLCERPLDPTKTHIDHDHRCCPQGTSCLLCRRGMACDLCNVIAGFAADDPDLLIVIAKNLRAAIELATERIASKSSQPELF